MDPNVIERLEQNHRDLERSLSRLIDFAKASDDPLMREEFDVLEPALLAHLDGEEMFLLPAFEGDQPSQAGEIREAHARIRQRLGELGVLLDLRVVRADDLVGFRDILAAHAAREADTLYPWARANADHVALRLLVERIRPAAGPQDPVTSALARLRKACEDGEMGYRAAASDVSDRGFQIVFEKYAKERAGFGKALGEASGSLGAPAPRDGSLLGAMHRGWLDAKATVTGGSAKAVLRECQRGEDAALDTYRATLHTDLPTTLRETVQEQYEAVKKARAEIASLLDRRDV